MSQNMMVRGLLVLGGTSLLLSSAIPARADLVDVNIFDNTTYQQTSSSAPTSVFGYFFNTGGDFQTPGDFASASVTIPTLPSSAQVLNVSGTSFGFGSLFFPSLSDLHNTYPFGSYTITASGGTVGSESVTLSYLSDPFTSDIPALNPGTFAGLQGFNPADAFTIDFNSFTPNSSTIPVVNEAFTFFTIRNSTGAVAFATSLPDTATSILLPANTLAPNTTYSFELDFSDRIAGTDPTTGVATFEGFDVRTDGGFVTGATVPEPASIALLGTAACMLAFLRRSLAKR